MPKMRRNKTEFPGVHYIESVKRSPAQPERVYYIRYRSEGKQKERAVGREFGSQMTPVRASQMREEHISKFSHQDITEPALKTAE